MKPNEAREMVRRQDQARRVRGDRLERFLRSGESSETVVPELIPTEAKLTDALRAYRHQARLAAGALGAKRARLLDETAIALARVVYFERVLALDPLERAALTPARLVQLSVVGPDDLRARLGRFQAQGDSSLELAG